MSAVSVDDTGAVNSNSSSKSHSVRKPHSRSDVCVGSAVCTSLGVQVVCGRHIRLLVELGLIASYSKGPHTVAIEHCLSDVCVAGTCSHSQKGSDHVVQDRFCGICGLSQMLTCVALVWHTVRGLHTRSDVGLEEKLPLVSQ